MQALVLDQIFIFFVCCHAVDGKWKLGDALVRWLPGLSALKWQALVKFNGKRYGFENPDPRSSL